MSSLTKCLRSVYSTMPFQTNQRSTKNQESIEGMQYSKTVTILKKVDGMLLMQLNTSKKGKELFGYVANEGNEFMQKKKGDWLLHIECTS